ncbi:MAG: HD domain-containing protein [Lachnospiraceae bacterium]|nr:HD domain-containing protein [Lachnospiraceae bacterium]
MANYHSLSKELIDRIEQDKSEQKINPYAFKDEEVIRRYENHDEQRLWRTAFISDIEKIMHSPYYNRYTDKTQVFSFYKNDDISRRALHVQFVSRIARNIGKILGLNLELIEAIALGHDIGHTPFGHAGERILSEIYREETGRYFNHNVHSVRVLDKVIKRNISLQTLDGVLCHNGELECKEYRPAVLNSFKEFDIKTENCYIDENNIKSLVPSTLEACVVRICDIIAYLGKDRQDAVKLGIIEEDNLFKKTAIGTVNPEIINNLVVNIIENSYGKPYLQMDEEHFNALKTAKNENYDIIYKNKELNSIYDGQIKPMFKEIYYELLEQARKRDRNTIIYEHHIKYVNDNNKYNHYKGDEEIYEDTEPNKLVVDYIASMTDDYFIELYKKLFPNGKYMVEYKGYFDN